jgi:hypothetical protein
MGQPSMVNERTGESERVGEQSEHPLRGVFAMFARTPRTLRTLFVLFAMFATAKARQSSPPQLRLMVQMHYVTIRSLDV